jgi:LmbE family N-acetylglucosaminyl deacetylase
VFATDGGEEGSGSARSLRSRRKRERRRVTRKLEREQGIFLGYGAYFGAPLEPEKIGIGHVLYAVQGGSNTAAKAAENSGQSPGNLHCSVE